MKRMICCLLTLLCLCASVFAQGENRVFDQAGLFTAQQKQELDGLIEQVKETTGMDIAVVTTGNAKGKSARAYADDYYDQNGFGAGPRKSGALFLIDMDNREIYISTCGDMIDYLTDKRIDKILDSAYGKVTQEDYAGAAAAALQGIEKYVKAGVPGGAYRYDTETGKVTPYRSLKPTEVLIAILIALAAGIIPCAVIYSRYSGHAKEYSYPYQQKSKLTLTAQEDTFLHQTLTQRHIDTSSHTGGGSSGGGSSTHTSSGGSTHGGGGRSF